MHFKFQVIKAACRDQWAPSPRASVATPWDAEGISMGTPCKGKSVFMGAWAVLL